MRARHSWRTFVIAGVASALAAVLVVAVGPSFSEPKDEAVEATTEAVVEETTTEEVVTTTAASTTTTTTTQKPHSPAGNSTASTTPDTHGHIGSGTGTSTGSQADPGHKADTNGTDGKSNGPGTGDTPAPSCPNDQSSVNGDTDSGTGGANTSGPYNSTCDGRISQNGQGDDAPGGGTPCAGCVGNADDKNPPGQVREFNGQKANDMGYECDGNQGVGAHYGNGNPAHTGRCALTTTTPTCPANSPRNAGLPIPAGQTAETFCTVNDSMTIRVDCFSVTVTSTKDISNVRVFFVDGTMQEINVNSPSFSQTFTKQISHATAKSGQTVVSGSAPANCGSTQLVNVCRKVGNTWTIVTGTTRQTGDLDVTAAECNPTTQLVDVCRKVGNTWIIVRNTTFQTGDLSVDHVFCKTSVERTDVCRNVNGVWIIVRNTTFQTGDLPVNHANCIEVIGLTDVCRNVNGMWTIVRNTTLQTGDLPVTHPNCKDTNTELVDVCRNVNGMWTIVRNTTPQTGDKPVTASECNPTPPTCPANSDRNAGMPIPPGQTEASFCNRPPVLCPVGSDKEGQPMPGGDIRRCYNITPPPEDVCPEGTDLAGQPMPQGDIRLCNEDVLSEVITNPPTGEIDGEATSRPRTQGGILPRTGASFLGYLVVALEMIGAGVLLLRARKR